MNKKSDPMFDFEDCSVDELSDNHTDNDRMAASKRTEFGSIKGNTANKHSSNNQKQSLGKRCLLFITSNLWAVAIGATIIIVATWIMKEYLGW